MKNDYDKIKKAFNKAATSYDENCFVQQLTGKKLIKLTKSFTPSNRPNIIDLGCGTGFVTEQLCSEFDFKEFHAIDIASELLCKAKERLGSNIKIYQANFDALSESTFSYDIIFSNMALHWSRNIEFTLISLAGLINNNGILAFSIPLSGTFDELPKSAKNLFLTSKEIQQFLIQAKFNILNHSCEEIILPFQDTITGLRMIKKIGANYVRNKKNLGLMGKSFLKQIRLHQLTYHIGYFIVKRIT